MSEHARRLPGSEAEKGATHPAAVRPERPATTAERSPEAATRPDVRAARLAARQSGVVTTRQLAVCGLDANAVAVRVARGQLHPVFRGVYAVGHDALTQTGRFTAAVLAAGEGAALSDHAAAAHLGMRRWDDRRPAVIVPRAGARKIDGIDAHRRKLDERDVWVRDGIRVTSPARTILDLAATSPPGALRRLVRQAQAEQRVNVRQLQDVVRRNPRHRGAARLSRLVADGPAPTRSGLEDVALELAKGAGVERPEVNARLVLGGRRIEPDLLWRARRLVVECDGERWHADPLTRQDDVDRQALLEAHGYRVLRIAEHQLLEHPRQTLTRVRAALAG